MTSKGHNNLVEPSLKCKLSPHNIGIERTARGRHALCILWVDSLGQSKGRAGDAPGLHFPVHALRPCSPLIPALYGRNKITMEKQNKIKQKSGNRQ